MEIINESSAFLSNSEVYSLLSDIQNGRNGQKRPNKFLSSLATITFETLKHLEKTPCRDQSPEIIHKFLEALKGFNLTRAEKLQLLNHRPKSAVEIQLIIEESEERLSEEQIEEILVIVNTILPGEDTTQQGQEQIPDEGQEGMQQ